MTTAPSPANCDYCGLPVPVPLWGKPHPRTGPHYCCLGCQFAKAVVVERSENGTNRATMLRLGLSVFFTMNVMVFTFALWAYDLDATLGGSTMASSFAALLRSICLLVSLPVLLLLGGPLAESAWRQVWRRAPSTDLLILTGVVAAFAYSAWSVWTNSGSLYVETGCVTLVFLTLGRWLEATGKLKSTESLEQLENLLPKTVSRLTARGIEVIPLEDVRQGDRLRVSAGQRIPADAVLVSSLASIDRQLVSGESWPSETQQGDALVGGTLNLVGDVIVQVTVSSGEGTLARLVAAVREARLRQGPYQRLAERITSSFFPIITLVATVTLAIHWWLGGFANGLMATLSVLLIACPCALGIATPLAVWAALGAAARRGIVIGSGETIEKLAQAKAIRFDKTGTLTLGNPRVEELYVAEGVSPRDFQERACLLAQSSTHVFSQAIARSCGDALASRSVDAPLVSTVAGRGVYASLPGEFLPTALGSARLMSDLDLELPDDVARRAEEVRRLGQPYVLLGWGGSVTGLFTLAEQIRPEAANVIADCRALGLDVAVLTGDHSGRGARLAKELHVPLKAELDPRQKMSEIASARERFGPVIMVGDGLNDAGACGAADIGIAMGCGADITRDSADVCLVSDELQQIPWLLSHSRRTVEAIRGNLFWSFAYNAVGVSFAAAGWLHPSLAAVLMVGSSLYVIANSLRLSPTNEPRTPDRNPGDDAVATTAVEQSRVAVKGTTHGWVA